MKLKDMTKKELIGIIRKLRRDKVDLLDDIADSLCPWCLNNTGPDCDCTEKADGKKAEAG